MITKEVVLAKYGNIPLKFSSYYKYQFYFGATAPDGARISGGYGGDADDIYRYEVDPDKPILVKDYEQSFMSLTIRLNNETIFDWSDF